MGKVHQSKHSPFNTKGFTRCWTPNIKKLLGELLQAESEKGIHLKCILQRLIERFCDIIISGDNWLLLLLVGTDVPAENFELSTKSLFGWVPYTLWQAKVPF
ncbi:hypothetical protein CIPAW_08G120000 [Carya illinoinensis]|uniref:Uncharacterized protein n=1 Tax=Carya illinoinensis TaxID=32201 RepID=A0A8T1PYN8_CARIL|nr:hypothetical protein CIPAW_08G120000 [Carya illinoinensis]